MFQGGVGELTASSLPRSLVPRVRRQPGVADATPIAVATGELARAPSFLVFGVEPGSFVGAQPRAGRADAGPRAREEALVGDAAAAPPGASTSARPSELARGRFRIVGVYHAGVPFEDQGAALLAALPSERMRGRTGDATTIAVKIARGDAGVRAGRPARPCVPGHRGDQPARTGLSRRHQQPAHPASAGGVFAAARAARSAASRS